MNRRAGLVALLALGVLLATPGTAVAHGIGGRLDLPVPLSYFIAAAGVVLVISFVALAVLWPEPRFQDGSTARPTRFSTRFGGRVLGGLGGVGLILTVGQVLPSLGGQPPQPGRPTIAPVLVWVVMWLVIPFASALVGNWYRLINPWRAIGDGLGFGDRARSDLQARLGVWPASLALLAFTWFELVSPDSANPAVLGWAALIYTGYLVVAMAVLGTEGGLEAADFFTTYNRMFSAISPLGRARDGRLVWRGWLRTLPQLEASTGFTLFVLAAIGTVTYDGASGTEWFRQISSGLESGVPGQSVLLVAVVAAVVAAYWAASWAAAALVPGFRAAEVARRFAHTLVPIALAYALAHYATLIIFEGQQLISAISDPLGLGWDGLGTADRSVDFFITATEPVWYFQLLAIVAGHILAVILAHDRALADFGLDAVRSQYAMLLLMVGLTSLGLLILAG